MNERSHYLIGLAKEFIASESPDVRFASIGGSTARGEADLYSDIDLTIYTDSNQQNRDKNAKFKNEIIQLHFAQLPLIEQVHQSPWTYRSFSEIKAIKDERSQLANVQGDSIDYFKSTDGEKKMVGEVLDIVKGRARFALECLEVNRPFSATHAAMGAWSEAAFLHMFLTDHTLSTGNLIPFMRRDPKLIDELLQNVSIRPCKRMTDFSPILHLFREFLRRKHDGEASFDLDPLQDQLCERKNERLIKARDMLNLQWQMYGEALWLYFGTEPDRTFEQFYADLPTELKQGLSSIGFIRLEKQQIIHLCNLSQSIIHLHI